MSIDCLSYYFSQIMPDIVFRDDVTKLDTNKQWRNHKPNPNYIAVLRPRNEIELISIFKICDEHNIGVVPRAGGTALTNGSTIAPEGRSKNCVLVQPNFTTKKDIEIKGDDVFVTVSPGVTARDIETLPNIAGRYKVPVDLGIGSKEGIAEIVGYLANNAAGTGAAFHGRAIDMVDYVRAIKADGTDWEISGDDPHLNHLIGMGGTTGFITEARIKLQKIPDKTATVALPTQNILQMYELLETCKEHAWDEMQLFERMNYALFNEVVEQLQRKDHEYTKFLNDHNQEKGDILFIQLGTNDPHVDLESKLNLICQLASFKIHKIIPSSKESEEFLLSYRIVNASTACEKHQAKHGGKVIAFDISVPAYDTAPFPSLELIEKLERDFVGIKIFSFGHAASVEKISATSPKGGTALHFNPILPEELLHREQELYDLVFDEVSKRGGKIVSEHSLGTKLVEASKKYTPEEYNHHQQIIRQHDPLNILNPDVIVFNY